MAARNLEDPGGAPARAEDPRGLALAHAALDELGVPRTGPGGRLTLFGRIEALRAGKYDPDRINQPVAAAPRPLHRCPRCGLFAMIELGALCPACSAELEAAPA